MVSVNKNSQALRLPGSTVSLRLKVYDTPCFDGQIGGTPHVHLLATEMYFVLAGEGAVEVIDKDGFSQVELFPHSTLVFSPGIIHRLINPNKDLEILVIEQNGLPERGDSVVCFTNEWLESDKSFARAMKVSSLEEAYLRRTRGVEGFLEIKAAFSKSKTLGKEALGKFYQLAVERTLPLHSTWKDLITNGALAEAQDVLSQLSALATNNTTHLFKSQKHLISSAPYSKLGCCGHLNRHFDDATLMLEGLKQAA
ncbi:MAG: cupin domain-containing protein [Rhizonema sp. PD37]|nr:cupin domain-containing protein [Rhizonema sp. PD37]